MSRIDELIEKLCPDGVKYKALGEMASYAKGRIAADQIGAGEYVGVNELLQEHRGRSAEIHIPSEDKCIAFEAGDILLGNIRPYLKKMWLADCAGGTNGDVLVIRVNDASVLSPDFLWQILAGGVFTEYNVSHSKGAKMPRGGQEGNIGISHSRSPCGGTGGNRPGARLLRGAGGAQAPVCLLSG